MCALESLRDALRRRDIYVAPSERYADARASLLGDIGWDASREDTRRSLSLPPQPGPFVMATAANCASATAKAKKNSSARLA